MNEFLNIVDHVVVAGLCLVFFLAGYYLRRDRVDEKIEETKEAIGQVTKRAVDPFKKIKEAAMGGEEKTGAYLIDDEEQARLEEAAEERKQEKIRQNLFTGPTE